jgi:hypothetical protein
VAREKASRSKAEVEGIQRVLESIATQVAATESRDVAAVAAEVEARRQRIVEFEYAEKAPRLRETIEQYKRIGDTTQANVYQHQLDNLRRDLEKFHAPPVLTRQERRTEHP